MVTKNYDCPNCGIIEVDKKITEPEITNCPKCNSEVKRIFTPLNWLNFEGAYGKTNNQ